MLLNDVATAVAVIVAAVIAVAGVIRVSVVIATVVAVGSIEAVTDAGADYGCGGNRKFAMPEAAMEAAAITGAPNLGRVLSHRAAGFLTCGRPAAVERLRTSSHGRCSSPCDR